MSNVLNTDISTLFKRRHKNSLEYYQNKPMMNLAQKDNSHTTLGSILLYSFFVIAVIAAVSYFWVYGLMQESAAAESRFEAATNYQEELLPQLADYNEVKSDYSRYSYGYLTSDDVVARDRTDILDLLESTVRTIGTVGSTNISGNNVQLDFITTDLDAVSKLVATLKAVDGMQSVSVSTAGSEDSDEITVNLSFTMSEPDNTASTAKNVNTSIEDAAESDEEPSDE